MGTQIKMYEYTRYFYFIKKFWYNKWFKEKFVIYYKFLK